MRIPEEAVSRPNERPRPAQARALAVIASLKSEGAEG